MATFVKRNGGWKAIIRDRVGAYVKSKTFSTKGLASEWAENEERRYEKALASGSGAHATTLAELLDLYRREQPVRARERKADLDWWAATLGADTHLADIRPSDVSRALQSYFAGKAQRKMRDGKVRTLDRTRGGASANRRLSYLSAAFKLGADPRHGLLNSDENPCLGVKRYEEPEERTRVLSADELSRLLAACRASTWDLLYVRVLMAMTSGGRPGEVERLRWGDIHWKERMAVVPRDVETGRISKTKVERVLLLTEPAIAELERIRNGHPDDALVFGRHTAPGRKGPSSKAYGWRKVWELALDKAKLPRTGDNKVVPYNLRHSYATVVGESLLAGGVEASAAQLALSKLLGHASLETTKRYFHPRTSVLQGVADRALGSIHAPPPTPSLPAPEGEG